MRAAREAKYRRPQQRVRRLTVTPGSPVARSLGAIRNGLFATLPFAGVWLEDAPEIVQGSVTIEHGADSLDLRVFDLEFAFDGREEESRLASIGVRSLKDDRVALDDQVRARHP